MKDRNVPKKSSSRGLSLSEREKKQIIVLGVLFLMVIAFILVGLISGQKGEKTAKKHPAQTRYEPMVRRGPSGSPVQQGGVTSPVNQREVAETDLKKKLQDFASRGLLQQDANELDPEVLDYLLKEAFDDYRVSRVPEALYRSLPEQKALFDFTPYLGRLVVTFGTIVSLQPPDPYDGSVKQFVKKITRGTLRTESGTLYRFVSGYPIERKKGDWIQIYGIFCRQMEGVEGGKEALELVLTKKPERAYPDVKVARLEPKKWAPAVKDGDDVSYDEAHSVDEAPFWLTLNYVKNLGVKGYRKERDAGKIQPHEMSRTARALDLNPKKYRFSFVSVTGRIVRSSPNHLDRDNPGKIRHFTSAFLLQPDDYLVRLVSLKPLEDFGIDNGDFIRVQGIFYKAWRYVPAGADGQEVHEIPLVVVTDVTPVSDNSESGLVRIAQWVIGLLAVLVIVVFVVRALNDRKAQEEFRRRNRERRRVKETRIGSEGPKEPPAVE